MFVECTEDRQRLLSILSLVKLLEIVLGLLIGGLSLALGSIWSRGVGVGASAVLRMDFAVECFHFSDS